jgi:cell division protein FtsW
MKLAVTTLAFCVAALLALGLVMLYSSSSPQVGAHYLNMQLVWCGLGLVGCLAAALLDYRRWKGFWWLLIALAVVLLALVLVPIPHVTDARNGARRWFGFHQINFQPSEFAKLALILFLAWFGEHYQRQMGTFRRGILLPGLFIAVVVGLIFVEPDVGNAILLSAVSGILLLIAGIRLRYFVPPVVLALLAVSLFIYHNPMRSQRIYSWLHVEETRKGKGLQAWEAMIALGSGGVTGKGLGDGRQKRGWVPEHHTDFIFSIIGEELGLIATLLVLLAFAVILLCGLYISARACDAFGFLLGSGITFLIGMQAAINIGVVTSALPNKGMPLPFISYGGSNLLFMLASIGLLFSIARQARDPDVVPAGAAGDEPFGGSPAEQSEGITERRLMGSRGAFA